ncbi:hypothetical protein H5410_001399 [Solanum commersonii]|uniref:Uncharacterized protein n=1 Tax=Solanum commersonii TaxID=4109 RepID=A0A9J6AZF9_SOLCO|nr:hypothetical protein H5410_001399 [Solanum commersonii]
MEIPPSPLSPKYRFQLDSIYENFVGNLAVISEMRGEASFEVSVCAKILGGGSVRRPFGGKDQCSELEQRGGFVGYGFLVRLSMFRHLFIDLLEYGGLVLSMLNFYSSAALDLISGKCWIMTTRS